MSRRRTRDAVRLVWPAYQAGRTARSSAGSRRGADAPRRAPDGLQVLRKRAFVRAAALTLRPLNATVLAALTGALLISASAAFVPPVVVLLLAALTLERLAIAPRTRRAPRIVGAVTPSVGFVAIAPGSVAPGSAGAGELKRAVRIVSGRPELQLTGMPPHRPRGRISERRPGPYVEEEEE